MQEPRPDPVADAGASPGVDAGTGPEAGPGPDAGPGTRPDEADAPVASPGGSAARNLTRDAVLAQRLETAKSLWAKFKGLMGRPSLDAGDGLWLPDSNGIHMMFMRFAIDAVFLGRPDADGTRPVVSVHERLPAWRGLVPLVRGAHGVLELPVGTIAATSTVVGDRITID